MKHIAIVFLAVLLVGSIAAGLVRRPVYGNTALLVQQGTCVGNAADGRATNTFTTAYSATPAICISIFGVVTTGTNYVQSATPSNFVVYSTIAAAVSNRWIAVGTP